MKKIFLGLLVIIVLVAGGLYWLFENLDSIVKSQIEQVGSELTGVSVRVGGVGIDLTSGAGQISQLTIGNPDGYAADNAFDMTLLRLAIDIQSIGKQPLVLNELTIDSPEVFMEVNESGGSNLKDILDNISRNSAAADDAAATDDAGAPLKIAIKKLVINGVAFSAATPLEDTPRTGTLPMISKSNVGGQNGATPAEIGKIIVGDLSKKIIKQAAEKKLMDTIGEKTGGVLKGLGDALKKDDD